MPEPVPAKRWRKTKICLRCAHFTILLVALLLAVAIF